MDFLITICQMQNNILDFVLLIYTEKNAEVEFGDKTQHVVNELEKNFRIEKNSFMLPLTSK